MNRQLRSAKPSRPAGARRRGRYRECHFRLGVLIHGYPGFITETTGHVFLQVGKVERITSIYGVPAAKVATTSSINHFTQARGGKSSKCRISSRCRTCRCIASSACRRKFSRFSLYFLSLDRGRYRLATDPKLG